MPEGILSSRFLPGATPLGGGTPVFPAGPAPFSAGWSFFSRSAPPLDLGAAPFPAVTPPFRGRKTPRRFGKTPFLPASTPAGAVTPEKQGSVVARTGGWGKLQAPRSRKAPTSNAQCRPRNCRGVRSWSLVLHWILVLGAWSFYPGPRGDGSGADQAEGRGSQTAAAHPAPEGRGTSRGTRFASGLTVMRHSPEARATFTGNIDAEGPAVHG
jgi:hypothetical protein